MKQETANSDLKSQVMRNQLNALGIPRLPRARMTQPAPSVVGDGMGVRHGA